MASEFDRKYKEKSKYKPAEPLKEYDVSYFEEIRERSRKFYKSHCNESRTNVLIYASDHYSKLGDKYKKELGRSFSKGDVSTDKVIRLTQNHIFKIINRKINSVQSLAPGCGAVPYKSDDIHQIKDAKLSHSVLKAIEGQNDWPSLSSKFIRDYFVSGEVLCNTYYDFDRGSIIDYEQVDIDPLEAMMNPNKYTVEQQESEEIDPMTGQPGVIFIVKDLDKPIRSGEVVFERLNNADVFIEDGVENWRDSAFVAYDRVVHKETVRYMIKNDTIMKKEDKLKALRAVESAITDKASYISNKDMRVMDNPDLLLMTYFYYRPSPEFPMGKIFIMIKDYILWELELQKDKNDEPIFPIDESFCIEFQGDPRGYSTIRAGRSPQNEINRCLSQIAQTQITLGDDKLVTTYTDGITEGQKLMGLRHIKLGKGSGDVTHIPGRTGEQYFGYLEGNIKWLYSIMEETFEDDNKVGQSDITATLFMSMQQKKKYIKHAKAMETFYCKIFKKALELAKSYMPDETIIQQVGSNEAINIEEFKNLGVMDYQVKIEPMSDDVESTFSRYLVTRDSLQYAADLSPKQKGLIMSQFPWINEKEKMFGDLIIDDEEANNIILALDRGEYPAISMYDNNDEILRAIARRRRKGDWAMVKDTKTPIKHPQNPNEELTVAQLYQLQYEKRKEIKEKELEELRKAQAGMIPTGGPQVKVDMYVNEPTKDGVGEKVIKATLPMQAIEWTMSKVAEQGAMMEEIGEFPLGVQADIVGGK